MRVGLAAIAGGLAIVSVANHRAAGDDAAAPIVEQLVVHADSLDLSAHQVAALEVIRERRARTLAALSARLGVAEAQAGVAGEHDALSLMQEIGRLRVLSERDALQQLTPAQRRRWAELQSRKH